MVSPMIQNNTSNVKMVLGPKLSLNTHQFRADKSSLTLFISHDIAYRTETEH